jgi:hypothetical protein
VQTDFTQDLPVGQSVRLEPNTPAAVIEPNALPQVEANDTSQADSSVPE